MVDVKSRSKPEAGPETPPPEKGEASSGQAAADSMNAFQELSSNLAKAAMIAQGAFAEAAMRQAGEQSSMSPDPFRVGPAITGMMTRMAGNPDKMLKAQAELFNGYMNLWQSTARRMAGEAAEPVVQPERGDRRFSDPAWSENPVFDAIKQSYLLSANWLNALVAADENGDAEEKRRVEFFTKMLTDAFSPSNFLMSNPVALLGDDHGLGRLAAHAPGGGLPQAHVA